MNSNNTEETKIFKHMSSSTTREDYIWPTLQVMTPEDEIATIEVVICKLFLTSPTEFVIAVSKTSKRLEEGG